MIKRIASLLAAMSLIVAAVLVGAQPGLAADSSSHQVPRIGQRTAHGAQAKSLFLGPFFYYAGMRQTFSAGTGFPTGMTINLSIHNTTLDFAGGDGHTLAEMSVEQDDTVGGVGVRQIVEVGWNIDPVVNGDSNPHLFTGAWVNDVFQGYNSCTDTAGTPNAGDTITNTNGTPPTARSFGIIQTSGAWWISYNGAWVCAFNNTLWSGAGITFTSMERVQVFDEMATFSSPQGCSDEGNGLAASDANAARGTSITPTGISTANMNMATLDTDATDGFTSALFAGSVRSAKFGGPGIC